MMMQSAVKVKLLYNYISNFANLKLSDFWCNVTLAISNFKTVQQSQFIKYQRTKSVILTLIYAPLHACKHRCVHKRRWYECTIKEFIPRCELHYQEFGNGMLNSDLHLADIAMTLTHMVMCCLKVLMNMHLTHKMKLFSIKRSRNISLIA